MHGDNEAKRKIQEEIKKRKSKFVALGGAGLGLFIPIALFLFVITVFYYLYESYIISSTAGEATIFKDDKMVADLQRMFDVHDYGIDYDGDGESDVLYSEEKAENNNFVQELRRQKYMWNDLYSEFGAGEAIPIPDEKGELDIEKYVVTVNYQTYLNLGAFYTDYDDAYDNLVVHDDVKLNEYENERVANNRDVRNFYELATDKVGSAFFLYPGMRKMVGNNIRAEVIFDYVHPAYWCPKGDNPEDICVLVNIDAILSQWSLLGRMYMPDEDEYTSYFNIYPALGPLKSAKYLVEALSYGYNTCGGKELDDKWLYYNVCNDYELIYKDSYDYTYSGEGYSSPDVSILERAIADHLGEEAQIPIYEYDENGEIYDTNIRLGVPREEVEQESERSFITAHIERKVDDDAYNEYLKNGFIPAVYIYCNGCNRNKSVDSVYTEMKQYEETYRYFNKQVYTEDKDVSSKVDVSWTSRTNYTCSGNYIGISGDYDNHHGTDLTSSISNPSVYPLMSGEVVAVVNDCGGYSNRCSNSYTLQYHNSSGQVVSDAVAYTFNTRLYSSLPAVCRCGGGLGNYVTVRSSYNGKDIYIRYGHMDSVNVSVGSIVGSSTVLGRLGNTGISTGPHLHIDVSFDNVSRYKPTAYFSVAEIKGSLCARGAGE